MTSSFEFKVENFQQKFFLVIENSDILSMYVRANFQETLVYIYNLASLSKCYDLTNTSSIFDTPTNIIANGIVLWRRG